MFKILGITIKITECIQLMAPLCIALLFYGPWPLVSVLASKRFFVEIQDVDRADKKSLEYIYLKKILDTQLFIWADNRN